MTTLLALDIGGTKVGWGIVEVGQNYTVVERGSIPTEASRGGADVAERICSLAASLKEAHPEASGVAIASAGVVDPVEGKIVSATDIMPGWGGTPLGKLVEERAGLPVRVLNDVHAHGLGEATASLVNCVDPAAVIISGSMTRSGDIWWDGLREGFAASAMNPVADTPILIGSLGGDAPLLGAVSFFLNA